MPESKKANLLATISTANSRKTQCLTKTHHWLKNQVTAVPSHKYRHRVLEECLEHREEMIQELAIYAHRAHEDFRQRIRDARGDSLSPIDEPSSSYLEEEEYPHRWPLTTLKGYFGEIFAGVIAEQLNPFDEEWEIPAFLFRCHELAFDQLEMFRQTGEEPGTIPGRTGDDFLAFQRNASGQIVKALVCEAKCTYKHDAEQIHKAHIKASKKNLVPLSRRQLIEILKCYSETDPSAGEWIEALEQLHHIREDRNEVGYKRYDLISYICGVPPVRSTTEILPRDQPHPNYTGGRWFEAVETILFDVEGLVEAVYQKEVSFIDPSIDPCELENYWQQVIPHISVPTLKAIAEQHCKLLKFNGKKAWINVASLPLLRKVLHDDKHIKDAFEKSGLFIRAVNGDKIPIRFVSIKP